MIAASPQPPDLRESGCAPALPPLAACRLLVLASLLAGSATSASGSVAAIGGKSGGPEVLIQTDTDTTAADTATRDLATAKARLTPKGALWRSALIPGWGQVRNGRYFKAVLFSAAAAGFAGASISETRNLDRAQASKRQAAAGRRNTRLLLFIATATISALDAYVDAHLADFGVSLAGSSDLPADFSLTWKFL